MARPRIGPEPRDHVGVSMRRVEGGVVEMTANSDDDLARGLGFAHAHDRQIQMMLVRLIGQGRLSECLRSDDETTEIDLFMRDMGFARLAERDAAEVGGEVRAWAQAYCDGVNAYLQHARRPWEFVLVGYRPEPWRIEDTLLTIGLMSYVGLAQSQEDMERLIVQALRAGVSLQRLKTLCAPHLDAVDDELVALLKQVREVRGLVPDAVRFLEALPKVMASNNWAVSAERSASGHALQCNDPHLECNRLPAVWYEWVGCLPDDFRLGITMPGVPGLVMGRTRMLSAGFTYGFMDMVDLFVEEIRDGQARRSGGWEPVDERVERIERKGSSPIEVQVRQTTHGVIEADPHTKLDDGLYLCRAWSGQLGGAARSLEALYRRQHATDVAAGMETLREVSISCNWLLADRHGHIAYQQSGLLPRRKHSGLHPVQGWDSQMAWDGLVPAEELSHTLNPPGGVLATANQDLNQPGRPLSINLPMGSYRVDRIEALLSEKAKLDLEDMKRIQRDLYSLQAERFLELLRPILAELPGAEVLLEWDGRYDAASRGATAFERFYEGVLREVFGKGLFGEEAWDAIAGTSGIVVDFYHLFDAVLLGEDETWFGEEGRDALFRRVLAEVLIEPVPTWGEVRQVTMTNLFFGGRLPRFLGFDHGPFPLEGNRATVVQGAIYTAHGRTTTFTPSYRYLTDLGTDEAHTVLAGGPSDRRWSQWYRTDIERWLRYQYKTLGRPTPE
jgi:penicillin amidase